MAPQLRLIFVHGISAEIVRGDYTVELCNLLRARLTAHGVLPANATQDQIDGIVTFERVNYSDVGQAEEEGVLAAYRQERGRLYSLPDDALELIAYDKVRAQMITAVSDCLIYESAVQREEIRQRVVDAVTPYVATGDAVSIVGHSLGSVVAFDTAYFNSRHNVAWLKAGFKPTNLFTMGSPIALFTMEMDDATGQQKPRYMPAGANNTLAPTGDVQPNLTDGVWYNFLDAQDLIAYPLATLFTGKFQVKDIRVETGLLPLSAHTGYWHNADVADQIALRLKLDLARIRVPAGVP
jgi:hypothetical protein